MTKNNLSLVAVVMDRSGSMTPIQMLTIDGFNEFLKGQQEAPGECAMYYTQFDHEYEIVHNYVPIGAMPELTVETYQPRGNTALLDAIGRTIKQVGADLAAKAEDERPANVIFVIQTDGEENASREYTRETIRILIAEHRDVWHWTFLFLGASEGAIKEAQNIGVGAGQTLAYSGARSGQAFASATRNVSSTRVGGQAVDFTDEERARSK